MGPVLEMLRRLWSDEADEGVDAQATAQMNYSTCEKTAFEVFLQLTGLLLIVLPMLRYAVMLALGYGSRFKDDNAEGATANALEGIWIFRVAWLPVFAGLALCVYASVRRIGRCLLHREKGGN